MSRVQLVPRQRVPQYCQCCHVFFFTKASDMVTYRWLEDKNGKLLWCFYTCLQCYYERMPKWSYKLVIEPPRPREIKWHGDYPVSRRRA